MRLPDWTLVWRCAPPAADGVSKVEGEEEEGAGGGTENTNEFTSQL